MGKGFSLLEVMVALLVLTIGMMSAALLMANVYKGSVRSRYIALASQLASEELEDLSRWPANYNSSPPYIDPHILVPIGSNDCGIPSETCTGKLDTDFGPVNITVNGITTPVSYFDTVCLTTQNGQMSETYQNPTSSSASYNTLTFFPDGRPPSLSTSTTPPTVGMTFGRRWVIEQDQPVVGVRRITVLVNLDDLTVFGGNKPQPLFQMSLVRP